MDIVSHQFYMHIRYLFLYLGISVTYNQEADLSESTVLPGVEWHKSRRYLGMGRWSPVRTTLHVGAITSMHYVHFIYFGMYVYFSSKCCNLYIEYLISWRRLSSYYMFQFVKWCICYNKMTESANIYVVITPWVNWQYIYVYR